MLVFGAYNLKMLRQLAKATPMLVAGSGALACLVSCHGSVFGESRSITSCAAGTGGQNSALRRRSTVGALADVKHRTTTAEERINALRAEMRSSNAHRRRGTRRRAHHKLKLTLCTSYTASFAIVLAVLA